MIIFKKKSNYIPSQIFFPKIIVSYRSFGG